MGFDDRLCLADYTIFIFRVGRANGREERFKRGRANANAWFDTMTRTWFNCVGVLPSLDHQVYISFIYLLLFNIAKLCFVHLIRDGSSETVLVPFCAVQTKCQVVRWKRFITVYFLLRYSDRAKLNISQIIKKVTAELRSSFLEVYQTDLFRKLGLLWLSDWKPPYLVSFLNNFNI